MGTLIARFIAENIGRLKYNKGYRIAGLKKKRQTQT